MKKLYLLILLALLPNLVSAAFVDYNATIDGIYYSLDSNKKTATVTNSGFNLWEDENPCYSGSIVIPPSITYNGVDYSVTSIGPSAFERCSELTSITIPNSVPRFFSNQRSSLPIIKKRK